MPDKYSRMSMKTLLYQKLNKGRVRCGICNHFCVIEEGKRGICQVRENQNGRLNSLVYPRVVARAIDPIEKKPIFHLKPGSTSYSIATVGCNFRCDFCQNADIAQMPRDHGGLIRGTAMEPATIVDKAIKAGCASISYTYTEPTIFLELALETARLANQKGLYNIFVTNGYMSPQALDLLAPVLDGANVDLKAFDDAFYRIRCHAYIEPVKENLIHMKEKGILVEVTTLLIPGLNDGQEELRALAKFMANALGSETPWHISRFHPTYRLTDRQATPVSSLETAYIIGKEAGLRYVYTGNAPGLESEHTRCHNCNAFLIRRFAYKVVSFLDKEGCCPDCGTPLYGIF